MASFFTLCMSLATRTANRRNRQKRAWARFLTVRPRSFDVCPTGDFATDVFSTARLRPALDHFRTVISALPRPSPSQRLGTRTAAGPFGTHDAKKRRCFTVRRIRKSSCWWSLTLVRRMRWPCKIDLGNPDQTRRVNCRPHAMYVGSDLKRIRRRAAALARLDEPNSLARRIPDPREPIPARESLASHRGHHF